MRRERTFTGRHPKGGQEGRLNRVAGGFGVVGTVGIIGCRTRYRWEKEGGQGPVILGDDRLSGVRSQRGWFLAVIYKVVYERGGGVPLQPNKAPVKAAS